jgi:rubrerythrin
MGWFFNRAPTPSKRKKVDGGLWYRTAGDYTVIVEASPAWYKYNADENPISGESIEEFRRYNLKVAGCENEGDATAVTTVFSNMDLFCDKCGEDICHDDDKCPFCGKNQRRNAISFTLTKVPK